jgi:hypothetical protein
MKIPPFLRYGERVFRQFWYLFTGGSLAIAAMAVYERVEQHNVSWSAYGGVVAVCVISALFSEGLNDWKRCQPQLVVAKQLVSQTWNDPTSQSVCTAYWLRIENASTASTVKNITTKLVSIEPSVENLDWLPIPLHLKHDNVEPHQDAFSLNPGDGRAVDIVSAVMNGPITIEHIVPGVNQYLPRTKGKWELTIIVAGENIPPVWRRFIVWQDSVGMLRCM